MKIDRLDMDMIPLLRLIKEGKNSTEIIDHYRSLNQPWDYVVTVLMHLKVDREYIDEDGYEKVGDRLVRKFKITPSGEDALTRMVEGKEPSRYRAQISEIETLGELRGEILRRRDQ